MQSNIGNYYYNKLWKWQNNPKYSDYIDYVHKNKNTIADEFKKDPEFDEICKVLKLYGNEKV